MVYHVFQYIPESSIWLGCGLKVRAWKLEPYPTFALTLCQMLALPYIKGNGWVLLVSLTCELYTVRANLFHSFDRRGRQAKSHKNMCFVTRNLLFFSAVLMKLWLADRWTSSRPRSSLNTTAAKNGILQPSCAVAVRLTLSTFRLMIRSAS